MPHRNHPDWSCWPDPNVCPPLLLWWFNYRRNKIHQLSKCGFLLHKTSRETKVMKDIWSLMQQNLGQGEEPTPAAWLLAVHITHIAQGRASCSSSHLPANPSVFSMEVVGERGADSALFHHFCCSHLWNLIILVFRKGDFSLKCKKKQCQCGVWVASVTGWWNTGTFSACGWCGSVRS